MLVRQCSVGMVMTNCYFIINEETKEVALVDPGDQAQRLLRQCGQLGLTVKAILLTHGHFDHILAVPALKEATGATVYASQAEDALLMDAEYNLSGSWQCRPMTVKADVLLKDGEEFTVCGTKVKMILTPGHTCGSCCYYLSEQGWLFSGDTLFCESYGRLDLPTAMPSRMASSINDKLLVLPEETVVYPGHDALTTIGHEKKHNPMAGWS